MDETVTHATEHPELRRAIGPWLLFFFVLGDIVGAGIYALVGEVRPSPSLRTAAAPVTRSGGSTSTGATSPVSRSPPEPSTTPSATSGPPGRRTDAGSGSTPTA